MGKILCSLYWLLTQNLTDSHLLVTDKFLCNVNFTDHETVKNMNKLNSNEANGCGMISMHMIKLCRNSIYRSLGLTLRTCLDKRAFPDVLKKSNIVPVHKNNDCYCRRVVPKNSFKHNRIYVLNNMTQMLQVSKNSNIKINYIQVSIHDTYKWPGH